MDEKDFGFGDGRELPDQSVDNTDASVPPEDFSFGAEAPSDRDEDTAGLTAEPISEYAEEEPAEEAEAVEAEYEEYENEVSEEAEDDSDPEGEVSEEGYDEEPAEYDDEYEDDDYVYEDEEEEEEEEQQFVPSVRRPARKRRPVKRSSKKSKKKKKSGVKVNNSIFGGLILVTIILTVSLVLAITGIKISFEYLGAGKSEDNITFKIPDNASPDEIADILIANNIIENKTLFKIAMKMQHSPTLFPGDVTLNPAMGYARIIEELSTQRDVKETVQLTFPEGITLLEVANQLEEKKVCTAKDFMFEFNKLQDFPFEKQVNTTADTFYKMEGFFFPDTYEFYVEDDAYNVTRTIRTNFANKVDQEMLTKIQQSGMTLSEVITLASIVQWEANSVEDMPKVASVFLNRLADSDTYPKLQSDATGNYLTKVINVVGDTASKEHYKDLYDTYICNGLPVGPVCNPGIEAIKAVLEPEKTNYYYFCNNLKTGKSYFAETYEEHEKNLVRAGLSQ